MADFRKLSVAAAFGAGLVMVSAPGWAACTAGRTATFPAGTESLATQTRDQVTITGGCIDGAVIGGNTPPTASFKALSLPGITAAADCTGQPSNKVIATTGTGVLLLCP